MPQNATLRCESRDGVLLVSVAARQLTTVDAVARFERELRNVATAQDECRWLLNFENTTFFITPAVKTILAITRKLRAHGGDLMLTGVSTDVRYILGLLRLDGLLCIAADVEAGVAELRASESGSEAAEAG
jgi:anti-anti-sigma regulatory factor